MKQYCFGGAALAGCMALLAMSAAAGLRLEDRCEPAAYTYEQRFSMESALRSIGQLREAMKSFRTLTDRWEPSGDKREGIEGIPHTDWETQYLGLPNWLGAVEGALRKQAYELAKCEWELAQARERLGEASAEEVDRKRQTFEKATQEFQGFWDAFTILD